VIVGGIPGAGKTTFLARTMRHGDGTVLDSADVRRRLRARLGRRVPYALYRPVVHAVHLLRVWRALAGPRPSSSTTAPPAARCGGCCAAAPPARAGRCASCCSTSALRFGRPG
jgi:hypothetical protein